MARFWRVARGRARQAVPAETTAASAAPTTVAAVSARRASGRWLRLLKYPAYGLAAAIVALLVLYAVSRILASRSDFDWLHVGCGTLALLGVIGMIGVAVWSLVAFERRRRGRGGAARPLLALSFAVFALVPFGVGVATDPQPSLRPSDALIWAGYGTTRDGITRVTATWVQPRVYPVGSRPNGVSFWVGLGDAAGHLEQIGTDCWCQRHSPATYDAWYELYPAPVVDTRVAVRPGDLITATVVRLSASGFRLTLLNVTTGARFSKAQVVNGVGNTHGTIIVEEPGFTDVDLAGFDPVQFGSCAFNMSPIHRFRLTSFDIVSGDGAVETNTSEVGADGASFTVSRR